MAARARAMHRKDDKVVDTELWILDTNSEIVDGTIIYSYHHSRSDKKLDPAMLKLLQENGISKIVITPSISTYHSNRYFNDKLDNLFLGITEIDINSIAFNSPVDELPITMKRIHFRFCPAFNKELNHLPPYLESLELFCEIFNQEICELPESLGRLVINSRRFDKSLYGLPAGLKYFRLRSWSKRYTVDMLPELPFCDFIEIWYGNELTYTKIKK